MSFIKNDDPLSRVEKKMAAVLNPNYCFRMLFSGGLGSYSPVAAY